MITNDWPYDDAAQHDPLTARRIAVVSSAWPYHSYIVAFDLDEIDEAAERPTPAEEDLLVSFLQFYIDRWYTPHYRRVLAERPLDVDDSANGYIFRKWGPDDWSYRQRTWELGSLFIPRDPRTRMQRGGAHVRHSLIELFEHIHSICRRCPGNGREYEPSDWVEWKAAHPEVFPR